MDTNAGEFVGEDRAETWMQRLAIGETIVIKGAELRVVVIRGRRVELELKSALERELEKGEVDEAVDQRRADLIREGARTGGQDFIGGGRRGGRPHGSKRGSLDRTGRPKSTL